MKIVHFVNDDKFVDKAISIFDSIVNVENSYILVRDKSNESLRYIKRVERVDIVQRTNLNKNDFNKYDVVVLHGWAVLPNCVIKVIPFKVKVVWFAWGYDIYSNKWPEYKLIPLVERIKPLTKEFYKSFDWYSFVKGVVRHPFVFFNNLLFGRIDFERALKRVDYFSGVLPIEYEMIKRSNSLFQAQQIYFSYSSCDMILEDKLNDNIGPTNNYIQVGNSASVYSNHLDIFDMLLEYNLADRKILVPLSYGGDDRYVNEIIKIGKKYWLTDFIPVLDYMPIHEYRSLIKQCEVAIFGDEQQASVGNILIALWSGARVFLSKTSMCYSYFKKIGCILFSIQDDLKDQMENGRKLSKVDILSNRRILLRYRSRDVIMNNLYKSIALIKTDIENGKSKESN